MRAVELRDGTPVVLRPITAQDREALRASFDRLSPESRYRRFFSPMPRLSEQHLTYLTEIDHHDHEALVAVTGEAEQIVGVARYVRTAPGEAEPAIVIADDWHGRGLGTTLMGELADRAREEGVTRFRALVLAENDAALGLLSGLGDTVHRGAAGEIELEIDLTPEPAATGRLGNGLRAAARGAVRPGVALAQRLGWHARAAGTDRDELANAIVVLAPRDDGDRPTVEEAARLAGTLGAEVRLVVPRAREEVPAPADAMSAELRSRGLSATVNTRRDDPATALVDEAAESSARLIVVPRASRSGPSKLLPGNLADTVAATAPCDVLIVRERDDPTARDTPPPSPGSSAG